MHAKEMEGIRSSTKGTKLEGKDEEREKAMKATKAFMLPKHNGKADEYATIRVTNLIVEK